MRRIPGKEILAPSAIVNMLSGSGSSGSWSLSDLEWREVVLLEAEDRKALERTHRRYFKTAAEILESKVEDYHPE